MAQHDYIISNATFPAVRADINNALSAIQTTNSGTSRPTGAVAGQLWLDTTSATTPTLKYYDGADDISLATIDHSANTVNWLDSTVSITGLSSTATGTVLTLSDSVNTTTVNLIIDNQKEIRFRETTANGTNYVALKAPASVASDLTFTLPATDGSSGQALVTNGSGVLSFASAGLPLQSVQTTGFTAVKGNIYPCNTTSASFTVTLPATPSAGDQIQLVDYAGTFDTNALTISPNGGKIEGGTSVLQLTGEREGVRLVYIDSTQGWLATSGINEGTDALSPITFSADLLVIAGGGGGGFYTLNGSGGGGAGGYLEGTKTLEVGTTYTVTIGAGGAGISSNVTANDGVNTVAFGATAIGGGGGAGATEPAVGRNGGSGGGAGANSPTAGTATQGTSGGLTGFGNNGGSSIGLGGNGGAGGGAGSAGSGSTVGSGKASSITGSSVTRAVGGESNSGGGTSGSANTGTGGGGKFLSGTSGSGGSGIVIVKYPDTRTISNPAGGLTFSTSTAGGFSVTSITAGTGNILFS